MRFIVFSLVHMLLADLCMHVLKESVHTRRSTWCLCFRHSRGVFTDLHKFVWKTAKIVCVLDFRSAKIQLHAPACFQPFRDLAHLQSEMTSTAQARQVSTVKCSCFVPLGILTISFHVYLCLVCVGIPFQADARALVCTHIVAWTFRREFFAGQFTSHPPPPHQECVVSAIVGLLVS